MSLKLCDPLGGDWPTWPVCSQCPTEIREGDRYAIIPGTLKMVCVSCAGAPAPVVTEPAPSPKAPILAQWGKPGVIRGNAHALLADQWSRKHPCCQQCGTTERKHAGKGLCTGCYKLTRNIGPRQEPAFQAEQTDGRAVALREAPRVDRATETIPERPTERPAHLSGCPCAGCAFARLDDGQPTAAADWRGLPFLEAL